MNVTEIIHAFVRSYPADHNLTDFWDAPLVALAETEDPRWAQLKTAVNPTHAMPGDLLPGARSVVAYFIPFRRFVAQSNKQGRNASVEWAKAYIETNRMILELNRHLQQELSKTGHHAAIIPATHNFDEEKLISDWSHRHVAFLAGLGSFGLNNMLITEMGCCGRLGSLVTDLSVAQIPKVEPREYCLFKHDGSCGKCLRNCIGECLTFHDFDRHRCYEMCLENAEIHSELGLADVCGKCVVGMPCSHRNPVSGRIGDEHECD